MAKLKFIKSDPAKEVGGVWRRYRNTDVWFLVARAGNEKFDAEQGALRRKLRNMIQGGVEVTERMNKDTMAPAYARHILLGWRNLQDDDGKDIPYSEAAALGMLRDPDLHDLYDWLVAASIDSDAYSAALTEESVGNSVPASTGS